MAIPLPILVLPWVLAVAAWVAYPWLARRVPRPDLVRWLPPGFVVVGGALLWLSASGRPAGGHDAHAAALAASAAALCDARSALPDDRDSAVRAFQDRAHDALHTLAADATLDRARAGALLRAKETVESGIASGASGSDLVAPMDTLIDAADAALSDIGVESDACER